MHASNVPVFFSVPEDLLRRPKECRICDPGFYGRGLEMKPSEIVTESC